MQKSGFTYFWQRFSLGFAALMLLSAPTFAQIQTVDPNDVFGADQPSAESTSPSTTSTPPEEPPVVDGVPTENFPQNRPPEVANADISTTPTDNGSTYQDDDLIGAAEGVFGKGAEGLAKLIEDILKKQGKPNGYIVGREAGGAFVVGLRYGSGTLFHKVEGEKPVYWTGPSIGFDAGANAGSTFVLVYNLYDTEDIYKRFASAEGVAYLVGGFNASYLRRGNVVLIPIRVGAGLRLGANVGYMKMSKKRRILPF